MLKWAKTIWGTKLRQAKTTLNHLKRAKTIYKDLYKKNKNKFIKIYKNKWLSQQSKQKQNKIKIRLPVSVFQIILWNWKHLTNCNVQGKKVFWHMILHSYLYIALCKFFIKINVNCFSKTYSETEHITN